MLYFSDFNFLVFAAGLSTFLCTLESTNLSICLILKFGVKFNFSLLKLTQIEFLSAWDFNWKTVVCRFCFEAWTHVICSTLSKPCRTPSTNLRLCMKHLQYYNQFSLSSINTRTFAFSHDLLTIQLRRLHFMSDERVSRDENKKNPIKCSFKNAFLLNALF